EGRRGAGRARAPRRRGLVLGRLRALAERLEDAVLAAAGEQARLLVDAVELDAGRYGEARALRLEFQRRAHEIDEDRTCGPGAGLVCAQAGDVVVAHPGAGHDGRR